MEDLFLNYLAPGMPARLGPHAGNAPTLCTSGA
jgi:hypothetical protein